MKKLLLIAFLLFTTSQTVFAQQAIAKIKYEEAEEAYSAKDYETTISKLDEVEAILKSTNPKVMYLRIMAQYPIILKIRPFDYEIIYNFKKLSTKYLKDYENVPDNEDKYRDIYKISEKFNGVFKMNDMELLENIGYQYKVKKDYKTAIKYYTEASSLGSVKSKSYLGGIYFDGADGVVSDYKTAFKYLKEAADNNDSMAQLYLGGCYLFGLGVEKNKEEANDWFKKSAAQGNEGAKKMIK
ncbi:MAG: hypothetical protein RLZZ540_3540 [Bacteroidota bacterium]|jgi:tetratricopeptide (TPR) repeat protein